ncbi:helix-turn-helix transcriptional regulator [Actinocorallia sp. API 0066]|uniref:helix-turn-helix domain-containing protein n=1 Tax=Actinocorallia sp. API 0066 TaxID=2896846 RepID=UPI001E3B9533|nr:helix-turn-helix transcriptional regulator [Actinocorallia sp. API 0066]MCD0449657.1 helix-turn-helix transcriptional regulator [Actinocorallia sp. API 0066]
MPARPQPTIRLRRLAGRLRRRRDDLKLSREYVAEHTGINPTTLYRIEMFKVRPQARTLKALLDLYEVEPEERAALVQLLKDSGKKGLLEPYQEGLPEEYSAYIEFEDEARSIWNYESLYVPGLLQTEAYARHVIPDGMPTLTADEVERRVLARVSRQAVLTRDAPLHLWAIFDEAALHRLVGGARVMREQILHLIDSAQTPNITVQVIPFDVGGHPGMLGSFVVMAFAAQPTTIYIDSVAGDLFLEEEPDVRRYSAMYEHLRAVALSPAASVELMRRRAASLE